MNAEERHASAKFIAAQILNKFGRSSTRSDVLDLIDMEHGDRLDNTAFSLMAADVMDLIAKADIVITFKEG